jgi:hypothetical protein
MSWVSEHQLTWRMALLVLMVVAIIGPWSFDRVYVPTEFECEPPHLRLEGDFCGFPLSGIRLFSWLVSALFSIPVGLINGEYAFSERMREFLFSWLLLIPLLPVFSTLLLVLRGNSPSRQILNISALILAIVVSLYFRLVNYPEIVLALWGLWLYIGLAVSALVLELYVFLDGRVKTD